MTFWKRNWRIPSRQKSKKFGCSTTTILFYSWNMFWVFKIFKKFFLTVLTLWHPTDLFISYFALLEFVQKHVKTITPHDGWFECFIPNTFFHFFQKVLKNPYTGFAYNNLYSYKTCRHWDVKVILWDVFFSVSRHFVSDDDCWCATIILTYQHTHHCFDVYQEAIVITFNISA